MQRLTIATRGSKLALWQANHIKDLLEGRYPGAVAVELLIVKTTGDKIQDVPLAKVGGKGLFVKEIEEALLDGRADLAVHSMKDVPAELPDGLVLGAIPPREKPTDTLLSVDHGSLDALPRGARVGTSSLRRQSQLLHLRPDLDVQTLRGNVDTRLRKLMEGQYAAIVMATAGMKRLGLEAPKACELGPPEFLPAVGQGALGIEYADARGDLHEMLEFLDHHHTRVCVSAERGFLIALEGGCQVPIAAHAIMPNGHSVQLTGLVSAIDGTRRILRTISGPAGDAFELGKTLARQVLDAGGKAVLDEVYGMGVRPKG